MAVLDVLLGVVPGAASGRHRDRDKEAGDDRAHQQTTEGLRAQYQPDDDGHQHRQERWNDHFLDRRLGQHVDRDTVFRLRGAFHDARDFLELAPHFDDDCARCATHGFHRHRAEQVRNQAAEEQADDDHPIGQVEADMDVGVVERMRVIGEQHECGQSRRTDRITFGHGLGRVADRVEGIGDRAHRVG